MPNSKRPVILLVEDEPLVLIHSHLALEDAGFAIVAATGADEALDALAGRNDIAALFTDVQLSGTRDGLSLARAVRASCPEMPIVVTSGNRAISDDALPAGAHFLPKPYTSTQVARLLMRLAA